MEKVTTITTEVRERIKRNVIKRFKKDYSKYNEAIMLLWHNEFRVIFGDLKANQEKYKMKPYQVYIETTINSVKYGQCYDMNYFVN